MPRCFIQLIFVPEDDESQVSAFDFFRLAYTWKYVWTIGGHPSAPHVPSISAYL